ncbi:MAG: hypothetical protein OXI87_09315 [Albidovulum sp.]|nr:hypothetical protein [Albidovulum sp.]MDE0533529.1 hypothetical protein [Albidovulum sp.]
MKTIMKPLGIIASVIALSGTAKSVFAEEGTFESVGSLLLVMRSIQMDGEVASTGFGEGALHIISSSGKPFGDIAAMPLTCVVYSKSSNGAFNLESNCEAAASSDDKFFLVGKRSRDDAGPSGGGEGHVSIIGGQGIFEGISGQCDYAVQYHAVNASISTFEAGCFWEID